MIMGGTDHPSVRFNEVYRLKPSPASLLGNVTRDLLPPLGITEGIGYAFPFWYVSWLSRKPYFSFIFVALASTGLIADTTRPLMVCQQTDSSNLLLKQGTI